MDGRRWVLRYCNDRAAATLLAAVASGLPRLAAWRGALSLRALEGRASEIWTVWRGGRRGISRRKSDAPKKCQAKLFRVCDGAGEITVHGALGQAGAQSNPEK